MEMISVLIAAYNEPEILTVICDGLACQDYRGPWELIVCDDGSSVDMSSVVKGIGARHNIDARYVWQPHRGFRAAASRNNGIKIAHGDLMVFLDGDILVQPDFLLKHAERHDGSRRIVCGTRRDVRVEALDDLQRVLNENPTLPSKESLMQMHWHSRVPWMAMLSCNFSVPRREEVLFDEHMVGWGSDDRDLAIGLVIRHGYKVEFAPQIQGVHIEHPDKHEANPYRTRTHEDIVPFIRNKLYLCEKYPDVDLRPTTSLLLWCYLDPDTDRWRFDRPTKGRSLESVMNTAREWVQRNRIAAGAR